MRTVLVVDDEQTIREVVADVLRDEGYAVVAAADGQAAVEAVDRERPDLVLMDVMMPGLDGRAAYLAMRSRTDSAPVPVVLMSGAVGLEGLNPSIAAFLPKPFAFNELLALVARLLGGPDAGTAQVAHE